MFFIFFSAISRYGFQKTYNYSAFSKNNTWFLLMPSTSLRHFVINLKLTWSTFDICKKKSVILMTSWEQGWQKVRRFLKNVVSGNDFWWCQVVYLLKNIFLSNLKWSLPIFVKTSKSSALNKKILMIKDAF